MENGFAKIELSQQCVIFTTNISTIVNRKYRIVFYFRLRKKNWKLFDKITGEIRLLERPLQPSEMPKLNLTDLLKKMTNLLIS